MASNAVSPSGGALGGRQQQRLGGRFPSLSPPALYRQVLQVAGG
nr:hypothetical protein [Cyanobium sp. BA20m-p-22]